MATKIRLTRKTRAPKMPALQQDDGLWDVAQEVEAFLDDHDLQIRARKVGQGASPTISIIWLVDQFILTDVVPVNGARDTTPAQGRR